MRISFWHRTNKRFVPEDLWHTPFGGAEMQCFNLARELVKEHDVYIYCNPDHAYDDGNFHIRHYDAAHDDSHEIFICKRADDVVNRRYIRRYFAEWPQHVVLWTGDDHNQRNNQILYDSYTVDGLDKIVVNGTWQRDMFIKEFMLPEDKVVIIRNGVVPEYYADMPPADANKFIHASTVYRGVHNFVRIWPKIKDRIPDAVLHVYSKTTLYLEDNVCDEKFGYVFDEINKLQDVVIHDPLPQSEIAKEYGSSYLMLYPNSQFQETACNAALESIAAGCPVVTSSRAGLPETVGDFGYLCEAEPESDEWVDEFVEATVKLHGNRDRRNALSEIGSRYVLANDTWEQRAKQWNKLFEEVAL